MLTLNDGRSEFWQWDTGRKLTVDADCSQVHFSNKVFGRSIDVDVVDGVAIVPDILLQTEKDLNVWAFVGTAENGYTKISKVFKVNRRNKPADYVFTPPEQNTLQELVERLDAIEESQDPDAIKNAVEDYLEQNPVDVPVGSVNGKTGDVELTAEDVGAISREDLQEATNEALAQAKESGEFDGADGKDGEPGPAGADGQPGADGYTPVKGVDYFTEADKQEIAEQAAQLVEVPEIEIPEALPNPNAITFTGAVEATYDGSVPVSVEIPAGGGGNDWRFITQITLAEDISELNFTDLQCSELALFIYGRCNNADDTLSNADAAVAFWVNGSGTSSGRTNAFYVRGSGAAYQFLYSAKRVGGVIEQYASRKGKDINMGSPIVSTWLTEATEINSVRMTFANAEHLLKTGTKIVAYVR